MTGVLWMLPEGTLPGSTWVFGLGLILIAGGIARYLYGIGTCCCSIVLGTILLVAGGYDFFGVNFPVFPALIILAGLGIVVGIVSGKKCCPDNGSDPDSSCCKPGEGKDPESENTE